MTDKENLKQGFLLQHPAISDLDINIKGSLILGQLDINVVKTLNLNELQKLIMILPDESGAQLYVLYEVNVKPDNTWISDVYKGLRHNFDEVFTSGFITIIDSKKGGDNRAIKY